MNLAELRETLRAHGYATDTDEAQNALLNAVYRDVLLERRWPWLQRQASLQVPAGSSIVDLSSIDDLRDVDALHIVGRDDPSYLDLEQLRAYRYAGSVVTGYPEIWTQSTPTTLEVYPTADRTYDVVVDYIANVPSLQDDADVPILPEAHHDVLVYGAIARMGIRERDANVRQLMGADYERSLARLRAASSVRQRQSTSQVVRSGLYESNTYIRGYRY